MAYCSYTHYNQFDTEDSLGALVKTSCSVNICPR